MFYFELHKNEYLFKDLCYLVGQFSVWSMTDKLNILNFENYFVNQLSTTVTKTFEKNNLYFLTHCFRAHSTG